METSAPFSFCRHATLRLTTDRPTGFVDLTDRIADLVGDSGVQTGFVNIQTLHTTTAVVVNEHEPLLLADFVALLEQATPGLGSYRHDAATAGRPDERPNGRAHCRALLLCPAAMLNVAGGRIQLGRWQRIFLAELDGPRLRDVSVLVAGEGPR